MTINIFVECCSFYSVNDKYVQMSLSLHQLMTKNQIQISKNQFLCSRWVLAPADFTCAYCQKLARISQGVCFIIVLWADYLESAQVNRLQWTPWNIQLTRLISSLLNFQYTVVMEFFPSCITFIKVVIWKEKIQPSWISFEIKTLKK